MNILKNNSFEQSEGARLELKSILYDKKHPERLLGGIVETVNAFLNTSGGKIIVGITDGEKNIIGLDEIQLNSEGADITNCEQKIHQEILDTIIEQKALFQDALKVKIEEIANKEKNDNKLYLVHIHVKANRNLPYFSFLRHGKRMYYKRVTIKGTDKQGIPVEDYGNKSLNDNEIESQKQVFHYSDSDKFERPKEEILPPESGKKLNRSNEEGNYSINIYNEIIDEKITIFNLDNFDVFFDSNRAKKPNVSSSRIIPMSAFLRLRSFENLDGKIYIFNKDKKRLSLNYIRNLVDAGFSIAHAGGMNLGREYNLTQIPTLEYFFTLLRFLKVKSHELFDNEKAHKSLSEKINNKIKGFYGTLDCAKIEFFDYSITSLASADPKEFFGFLRNADFKKITVFREIFKALIYVNKINPEMEFSSIKILNNLLKFKGAEKCIENLIHQDTGAPNAICAYIIQKCELPNNLIKKRMDEFYMLDSESKVSLLQKLNGGEVDLKLAQSLFDGLYHAKGDDFKKRSEVLRKMNSIIKKESEKNPIIKYKRYLMFAFSNHYDKNKLKTRNERVENLQKSAVAATYLSGGIDAIRLLYAGHHERNVFDIASALHEQFPGITTVIAKNIEYCRKFQLDDGILIGYLMCKYRDGGEDAINEFYTKFNEKPELKKYVMSRMYIAISRIEAEGRTYPEYMPLYYEQKKILGKDDHDEIIKRMVQIKLDSKKYIAALEILIINMHLKKSSTLQSQKNTELAMLKILGAIDLDFKIIISPMKQLIELCQKSSSTASAELLEIEIEYINKVKTDNELLFDDDNLYPVSWDDKICDGTIYKSNVYKKILQKSKNYKLNLTNEILNNWGNRNSTVPGIDKFTETGKFVIALNEFSCKEMLITLSHRVFLNRALDNENSDNIFRFMCNNLSHEEFDRWCENVRNLALTDNYYKREFFSKRSKIKNYARERISKVFSKIKNKVTKITKNY